MTGQRTCGIIILAAIMGLCPGAWGAGVLQANGSASPIKVLLLSGANNHEWQKTTPALLKIYKDSGIFAVDVTDNASTWTSATLAKYDVIVSNWTNFPSQDRVWGPVAEAALLDFVRQGKGFVLFHAASACLNTWPEFQTLIGATWGPNTGHGARHRFNVTMNEPRHAITTGLPQFMIMDELWHRMATQPSVRPLCEAFSSTEKGGSGQIETVALVTEMGRGRCFNLVLGHDVEAMKNLGWIMLMLRGTQWAATGQVTVEVPVDLAGQWQAVAEYEAGQNRAIFAPLDELTRFALGLPALRSAWADTLCEGLQGEATDQAKDYALRQLALIGSARHVPGLAAFLTDPQLSQPACSAMTAIGGDESARAMIDSLATVQGRLLAGVIHSLGSSRMSGVVPVLRPYLTHADVDVARAAVRAIAQIGGPQAVQVLTDSASSMSAGARRDLPHALLQCAEGLTPADKALLYSVLMTDVEQAAPVRRAAFMGLIECQSDPDQAADLLIEALIVDDAVLRTAALSAVRTGRDVQVRRRVAQWLAYTPASMRVHLIQALLATRDASVLPNILSLQSSPLPAVREAVIEAVGLLGDASHVTWLVEQMERVSPQAQPSVEEALVRLSGQGTDGQIIEALKTAQASSFQVALIRVLVARQCVQAVPVWKTLIWNPDRAVQTQAIRALGVLGDVTVCPVLIQALDGTASDEERNEIDKAITQIAERFSYPDSLFNLLASAVSQCDAQARASLYRLAGRFGTPQALDMVRTGLADTPGVRDVCIRTLAAWPNSLALKDLLGLAEHADNPTHRILALRGFASLYSGAGDPPDLDRVPMAVRAFAAARRSEEKKMLLAALPAAPHRAAFDLVLSCLQDPVLVQEATLAMGRMGQALPDEDRDAVRTALTQVLPKVTSTSAKAQVNRLLLKLNRSPNLARGAVATSPDGWDKDGAAGGDPAGIDGDPGTYWDEVDGKSEYRYRVTFAKPTTVSCLEIMGYAQHNFAPRAFDIVCDGKVVASVRDAVYVDNRFTTTFPVTTCQTLELHITGSYGPSPAIRELELYHTADRP